MLTVTPPLPVISLVTPLNGDVSGGYAITISGNFEQAGKTAGVVRGTATVGGLPCSPLVYDGSGRMLCTVPARQLAHTVCALPSRNAPALHAVQLVAPSTFENSPLPHGAQFSVPLPDA